MTLRRLRQILTYLTIILATLTITMMVVRWKLQSNTQDLGSHIIQLCELPPLKDGLTIRHAIIDPSEDPRYSDVFLTIIGPQKSLHPWLEEVDQWKKKRPGVILNYKLREAEMSSRIDFTAEIFVK